MGARLPRGSYLTTAEAAAVLKVSVATLKRWTQTGLLPSERTEGGHRRFRAEDVQALAAPLVRVDDPALLGADQLLRGTGGVALQAWLLEARRALGSWWAVAQPLRDVQEELCRRRAAGVLGAVPLEAATDRLRTALLRLAENHLPAPGDLTALVVAAPGDHALATPALLQLCLPESGWCAEWGGHPGVDDLEAELRRRPVDAVILSVSRLADPDAAEAYARRLEEAAPALATPVAVIGLGPWPDSAGQMARLASTEAVAGWLAGLAAGSARAHGHAVDLEWDPSLALGHEVVDGQHRTLFLHARQFLEAAERGEVTDGGREMLGFISDYARLHFAFEEELMRSSGYPAVAEHLQEHELFVHRLEALARAADGEEAGDATRGALARLARFLGAWLREHVGGSDQRIGQHLRARATSPDATTRQGTGGGPA